MRDKYEKPQMNADERRFAEWVSAYILLLKFIAGSLKLKNKGGVEIRFQAARALAICVAATLMLAGMVGASSPALSNSGGGTWQDFIEINIKENSGSTLKDYQVLVQLSETDFPINARSDGSDIRFADVDETELNYWIERWDYSGKNAKIWVKIPQIRADSNVKIILYYGNPEAKSASDGAATFEFFDDFEGAGINETKWQINYGTPSISDGVLSLSGGRVVTEKVRAFGYDHIFESLSKMSDTGKPPRAFLRSTNNYNVPDVDERFEFGSWDTIDGMSLLNVNDGKYSGETITEKFPTSFEVLGMARSAEKTEAFRQYVQKMNNSENIPGDTLYLQLYSWVGETHYIDWARVRKYTSTEPTLTFVSEKTTSDWKLFAGAIIMTVLIVAIIFQKRSSRKNSKNDIPNILLSITSNKGFKVGTWEKLDVNISNVGNGIAKDIEVKLLGPIETSGNKTVEILKGRGNQTSIVMGVKPKEHGNIPLKVEIIFFDQRGKRYELKEEAFVSVAKESETISQQQIPIINIGSIGTYVGEQVDKSTNITDSIVQRSNIGAGARKCPNCGREVEANEKFCLECGVRL
jgi:hypothetical protein